MPPPPGNKALLRPNQGTMVVNNPLIRPYFLGGGGIGGVPLDSHDFAQLGYVSFPGGYKIF